MLKDNCPCHDKTAGSDPVHGWVPGKPNGKTTDLPFASIDDHLKFTRVSS